MADLNPEMAFLQSMHDEPDASFPPGDLVQDDEEEQDEDEEDYDPSNLTYDTAYSANQTSSNAPLSSTDPAGSGEGTRTASVASDHKPTGTSSKQPRTLGGFVVSDDDEDGETPMMRSNAAAADGLMDGANGSLITQRRTLSKSPSDSVAAPIVPVHNAAQEKIASPVPSNGVINSVHMPVAVSSDMGVSSNDPTLKASQNDPASQATAAAAAKATPASLPKARLPQDRVGIMEDRIAEDPRGDIDAWLSLIGEHRKKNKLDEARTVYDRFFKVFPSAVSLVAPRLVLFRG